jgi:VanZ family protein
MQQSERDNGAWLPVIGWLGAIAAGTSTPVPEGISGWVVARIAQFLHLVGAAVFSLLTFRALRRSLRLGRIVSALLSGFLGGLVLTMSEAKQSTNPHRMSKLGDVVANLLGVVLGGMIAAARDDRS